MLEDEVLKFCDVCFLGVYVVFLRDLIKFKDEKLKFVLVVNEGFEGKIEVIVEEM